MHIWNRSRGVRRVKSLAVVGAAALVVSSGAGPIWAAAGTPAIQLPESFPLPGPAVAVAADPAGHAVWVAVSHPAELVRLTLPSGAVVQTLPLPDIPNGGIGLVGNQLLASTSNGLWVGSETPSGPSSVLGWSALLPLLQQQFHLTPTGSALPGCGIGLSSLSTAGGGVTLSAPLVRAFRPRPEGQELSLSGAPRGADDGLHPLLNPCGGLTPFWQLPLPPLLPTVPPTSISQLIGELQGIETALTDQGIPAADQGSVLVPWLEKVVDPPLFQVLGIQSLTELTSVGPGTWQKVLVNPSAASDLGAGLMLATQAADPSALDGNASVAIDPVTGAQYQIQPGQNRLWVSEPPAPSSVTVPLTPSAQDLTPYFQPMANGQSAMTVGHTTLFVPSSSVPYYQHLSPSALESLITAYREGLSRLGNPGHRFPAPSPLTVAGVVKIVGKHGQTQAVPLVRALPEDTVSAVPHLLVTHYGIDATPFTLFTPQVTGWSPKVLGLATGTGWGYAWGDLNPGIISQMGAVFGNQDEEMNGTLEAIYSGQALAGQSDQVQVTTHVFTWYRSGSVGVNASSFPLTVYGALPPMDNLQSQALSNILDTLSFNLPSVTDGTVEGDAEDLGMQLWNYLNKATSYYGDVQALQNVLQVWDNQYGAPQQTVFSSPPFTLTGHDTAQIAVDPSAEIINGGAGTADMATLSLVWVTVREWQVPVPQYQPHQVVIFNFLQSPPNTTTGSAWPGEGFSSGGPVFEPGPGEYQGFPRAANVPFVWYTGWGPMKLRMGLARSSLAFRGLRTGLPWTWYGQSYYLPAGWASDPGWQVDVRPLTGDYWNPSGTGTATVFIPQHVTLPGGFAEHRRPNILAYVPLSLSPGAYQVQVKLYTPDGSALLTDSAPMTLVVYPGSPSVSQYAQWYAEGEQLGLASGLPSLGLQFNANGVGVTVPGLPSSGTVLLERALFSGGTNGHGPVTVLGTASVQQGVAQFPPITPEPPGIPWALRAVWTGNSQIPPEVSPWTGPEAALQGGMGIIKLSASGPAMAGGAPVKLTGTVLGPGNQPATGYVGWARLTASSGTLVSTVMVQNGQFTAWYRPPASAGFITLTASLVGQGIAGQPITDNTWLYLPVEMAPAAVQFTVPELSATASAGSVPIGGQLLGAGNQLDPYSGTLRVQGSNGLLINGGENATVTVVNGQFVVNVADPSALSPGQLTLFLEVPQLQETLAATVPVLPPVTSPGSSRGSGSPADIRWGQN